MFRGKPDQKVSTIFFLAFTDCQVTCDENFLCSGQGLMKELPVTEDLLQLCHVDTFHRFCVRHRVAMLLYWFIQLLVILMCAMIWKLDTVLFALQLFPFWIGGIWWKVCIVFRGVHRNMQNHCLLFMNNHCLLLPIYNMIQSNTAQCTEAQ